MKLSLGVLLLLAASTNLACRASPKAGESKPVIPPPAASAPEAKGTVAAELGRECWYLFQAKNGDYWFGSEDRGVYRYDGTKIVNYSTTDGLSGDQIRGIQGDKAGNVYFTTSGGISKFDGSEFRTLTPVDPPDRENAGGWRLHPDDLWFAWSGAAWGEGPARYDGTTLYRLKLPASDREAAFRAEAPNPRGFSPYDVYSIYRDSRGHVWIGTSNLGVCRYDGRSFGWLYERHLTMVPGGGSFGVRSVIEDKDGAFWICNTTYRFRVQPENKDGKVVYTREAGIDREMTGGEAIYFQGAVADAEGDLWLSTYAGGVWRWDGASATNYPVRDAGSDTRVFRIFQDNAGVMWLGTTTSGAYRFSTERGVFEQFRP